jgi:hypothetical protein
MASLVDRERDLDARRLSTPPHNLGDQRLERAGAGSLRPLILRLFSACRSRARVLKEPRVTCTQQAPRAVEPALAAILDLLLTPLHRERRDRMTRAPNVIHAPPDRHLRSGYRRALGPLEKTGFDAVANKPLCSGASLGAGGQRLASTGGNALRGRVLNADGLQIWQLATQLDPCGLHHRAHQSAQGGTEERHGRRLFEPLLERARTYEAEPANEDRSQRRETQCFLPPATPRQRSVPRGRRSQFVAAGCTPCPVAARRSFIGVFIGVNARWISRSTAATSPVTTGLDPHPRVRLVFIGSSLSSSSQTTKRGPRPITSIIPLHYAQRIWAWGVNWSSTTADASACARGAIGLTVERVRQTRGRVQER